MEAMGPLGPIFTRTKSHLRTQWTKSILVGVKHLAISCQLCRKNRTGAPQFSEK